MRRSAQHKINAALEVLNRRFFGAPPERQQRKSAPPAEPRPHSLGDAERWEAVAALHTAKGNAKAASLAARMAATIRAELQAPNHQ